MTSAPENVQIYNDRVILTPTNEGVDHINEALSQQFTGESIVYHIFDSVIDDNCNTFCTDSLTLYALLE